MSETAPRGTVLYVHGLWLSGAESLLLRRRLAVRGWRLRVFAYSSLAESLEQVARRCAREVLGLARRTGKPVHLVGHSLGGIVIHQMFATGLLPPERFSGEFCRAVFLGSPVRGSQAARALVRFGPARHMLGGVGAAVLVRGLPERWPYAAELGIIAGDRAQGIGRLLTRFDGPSDGTVTVAETQLQGATDCCVLPVTHTGICFSPQVAGQIAAFIETGRFLTAQPGS